MKPIRYEMKTVSCKRGLNQIKINRAKSHSEILVGFIEGVSNRFVINRTVFFVFALSFCFLCFSKSL